MRLALLGFKTRAWCNAILVSFTETAKKGKEGEQRFLRSLRRLQRLASGSASDMARCQQGLTQVNHLWTTSSTQAIALLNLVFGIIDIGDATTLEPGGVPLSETSEEGNLRTGGMEASPVDDPIANDLLTSAQLAGFMQQQIGRLINHYKANYERVGGTPRRYLHRVRILQLCVTRTGC